MTVRLNTEEPFLGRIFAQAKGKECEARGNARQEQEPNLKPNQSPNLKPNKITSQTKIKASVQKTKIKTNEGKNLAQPTTKPRKMQK